jgi:hypothetical protein
MESDHTARIDGIGMRARTEMSNESRRREVVVGTLLV